MAIMSVYVALLRGINVGGHKIIKMEALRAAFASLGFNNVKSYGQSGNVIFAAPASSAGHLAGKIEKRIHEEFGFSVPVFIATAEKLAETIEKNPFLKAPGVDPAKLHVTFLSADPPAMALEKLQPLAAAPEQLHIVGRNIYLFCPLGHGNTKLSNNAIEKKLSVGATTRNWTTARTLLALASEK
jgi:uncharacterized protein (DUF1697 family)